MEEENEGGEKPHLQLSVVGFRLFRSAEIDDQK